MNYKTYTNSSDAGQSSSAWRTFRDRDNWIKLLLAADGDELCPGAKVVAARIALHHNIDTGQCNPAIGKLVLGTGMSESTVRRMIRRELEAKGWLRIDRTSGRHSNSFELRAPTLSTVTGFNPVNCDRVQDGPTLSTVTAQPCQIQPNPVTADTQKRESRTANRTAKEIDSLGIDLGDEDSGRRSRSPSSETDADFEKFYRQYPKHVAKTAAYKSYRAVITKRLATAEVLLAGAMRYAAERSGQDPKYTKHASTWLNGGCWADEPAKQIGVTLDGDGNPIRPPPNQPQSGALGIPTKPDACTDLKPDSVPRRSRTPFRHEAGHFQRRPCRVLEPD